MLLVDALRCCAAALDEDVAKLLRGRPIQGSSVIGIPAAVRAAELRELADLLQESNARVAVSFQKAGE